MEVHTRPPLVDGTKLGHHARSTSPELSLSISENDILSDEERELLQSPVKDLLTCVKDTSVNGGLLTNGLENISSDESCESAKCNGQISSDSLSDAASVFRTENDCVSVCAKEIGELGKANSKSRTEVKEDAYSDPDCTKSSLSQKESGLGGESDTHSQKRSQSPSGKSSSPDGPCEDLSGTDVIVEDRCSLDASKLHVGDKQKQTESSEADELDIRNDLSNTTAEGTSSVELSVDVKSSNEIEVEGVDEDLPELSDHVLDSGLSPKSWKSLKDFCDDLDEMEIPQVIDISSISLSKENESEQTSVVGVNEVGKDQTTTAQQVDESTVVDIVKDREVGIAASDVVDEAATCDVDVDSSVADERDSQRNGEKVGENEGVENGGNHNDQFSTLSQRCEETLRPASVEGEQNELVGKDGVGEDNVTGSFAEVDEALGSPVPDADESTEANVTGSFTEADEALGSPVPDADESTEANVTGSFTEVDEALGSPVPDADESTEANVTGSFTEVDEALGSPVPDADESTEAEFPAEETMVDYNMDVGQEEDGSPGYHGMTDDILPIIESELDDMPEGEGNIFDTEVECEDGGDLEEMEDTEDGEAATNLPADSDQDIGVDTPSHLVSGTSQTADRECGGGSTKKSIENVSSCDRVKLKRRASADFTGSPLVKILKRQSSLDNLDECAERSKSLDDFKKLSGKKLPAQPANIAVEPLDIPTDTGDNSPGAAPIQAKKRKTTVDDATMSCSAIGDGSININAAIDPTPSTSECSDNQKEQSMLVINLDDDDEEPESSSSSKSQSPFEEQEPTKRAPMSALDVLFNGKEEITLNRKMFTRVMKSYVSQYLLAFSDLGKATSLAMKANAVMSKIQSSVSSFDTQKEDFNVVMNKLLDDRQARKTWDETVVPARATRCVALQVCSVGSMYVKNGDDEETPSSANKTSPRSKVPSSSVHQGQALAQQKQAFAQQQMAMAQSRAVPNMRPIAKKSVTPANRPMVIKTVPAIKPATPIKPKPIALQYPTTAPKLNGLKSVTVTRNPEPAGNQNATPLTVTTVSPNSRTFTLSSRGTFALKSPQRPPATPQPKQFNTVLSKALLASGVNSRGSPIAIAPKVTPQNTSKAVPIAVTHTPGTVQNSKNLASGPGRPGKTPASISTNFLSSPAALTSAVDRVLHSWAQVENKAKKPASAVPDTTIDLTDLDDDVAVAIPQPTKSYTSNNTTARKSTAASRVSAPARVPPTSSKQMRHPPLPPNPPNFNPSSAPPRPYLGICNTQTVTQGIMLTWHFNSIIPVRKVLKFQVFAYQETKGDGEDTWKKVGDVDALPLPMACTLTQFREGYTYHFIVRALDEAGYVGPFSAPNTITLTKKTV